MNNYLTAIEAMENLLDLSDHPLQSFNRKEYKDSFAKYYQRLLPALEAIEELYGSVDEPNTMLSNMAQAVTAKAKEHMNASKGRNQKQIRMMNLNTQLAVYLFPSILKFKGNSSQAFAEILRQTWKEAFPKTDLQIASYDQIEAGFHRKFCYITTAVCTVLGKPDNCYELELLRDYRDNYLSGTAEGEEMIHTYYDIAPSIVKHINENAQSAVIYENILKDYIEPCISLIEKGEDAACAKLYSEMVYSLKDRFFIRQ